MKQKFLNILRTAGLALIAGAVAVSVACTDDKTDAGTDPGVTPGPGPIPDKVGEKVTENIPTPLTYYVESCDPGPDGVKVHVNTKTDDNIIFTCTPGERVKSYRLNVYPLIAIYDMLLDNMKEGVEKMTVSECEKMLYDMFIAGQAPTTLFTSDKALENETAHIAYAEDYAEKEFDWVNTPYAHYAINSGSEYLIMVEAYEEADGTTDAYRTFVYAATTSPELVGDPRVEVDLTENFTSYKAVHIPNNDAGGVNYFGAPTVNIDKFLNAFGDKRFIDYVRYIQGGSFEPGNEALTFEQGDIPSGTELTHMAFAVDINGTPNPESLSRRDFKTLEIPKDIPTPGFSAEWVENKTSSCVATFNFTMDENCKEAVFVVRTKAEAEAIKNSTENEQASWIAIINDGGWHVRNKLFTCDKVGYPNGEGSTVSNFAESYTTGTGMETLSHSLEPETEYVLICVGQDAFRRAANVMKFYPFKTKKRILNNPEACKSKLKFSQEAVQRNGHKIKIEYDYENTSTYHYVCIQPGPPDGDLSYFDNVPSFVQVFPTKENADQITREEWHYWLYDAIMMTQGGPTPFADQAYAYNTAGVDGASAFDLDPSTEYVYLYMAEDWDGICGPAELYSVTTLDNTGGPNPVVKITGKFNEDKTQAGFIYDANEDMTTFKYLLGKSSDYLLNRLDNPNYEYNDFITAWKTMVLGYGLVSTGFQRTQETPTSAPAVALAFPYGQDQCEGELAHLIYIDGEFKTLEDYKTAPAGASAGERIEGKKAAQSAAKKSGWPASRLTISQ